MDTATAKLPINSIRGTESITNKCERIKNFYKIDCKSSFLLILSIISFDLTNTFLFLQNIRKFFLLYFICNFSNTFTDFYWQIAKGNAKNAKVLKTNFDKTYYQQKNYNQNIFNHCCYRFYYC